MRARRCSRTMGPSMDTSEGERPPTLWLSNEHCVGRASPMPVRCGFYHVATGRTHAQTTLFSSIIHCQPLSGHPVTDGELLEVRCLRACQIDTQARSDV